MSHPAHTGRASLNEAQQRVIDELGATREHRPTFPDGLAVGLRAHISDALAAAVGSVPADDRVWMSKYELSQVLGCEVKYLDDRNQPFAWRVANARGTVAHRAIEYSVHWPSDPTATELVDEALGALGNDGSSLADFLNDLPDPDRAQLRGEATNATQAFLDGFPPLRDQPQWRPQVEVRGRVELLDNRLVLAGKVDLALGRPESDIAGRVFVDLKTGRRHYTHPDDLRYYALIETMRFGTPPRAVASYYLEESRLSTEFITTEVLWAAADRVVDATARMVELVHRDDPPEHRPSLGCHWCPLLAGCEIGRAFLADTHDDEHDLLG